MRLIDYLKEKFLNELGFSEDTFILPDPCGIPMGGSGISCLSLYTPSLDIR